MGRPYGGFFNGGGGSSEPSSTLFRIDSRTAVNGQKTFTDKSNYGHTIYDPENDTAYTTAQSRDASGVSLDMSLVGNNNSLMVAYNTMFNLTQNSPQTGTIEIGVYYKSTQGTLLNFLINNSEKCTAGATSFKGILGDATAYSGPPDMITKEAWYHFVFNRNSTPQGHFYKYDDAKTLLIDEGPHTDSGSFGAGTLPLVIFSGTQNAYMDYMRYSDIVVPYEDLIMNET